MKKEEEEDCGWLEPPRTPWVGLKWDKSPRGGCQRHFLTSTDYELQVNFEINVRQFTILHFR